MSNQSYNGIERRAMPISPSQLEDIIDKASDKAVEKMKTQIFVTVGKGVVTKILYLVGVGVVALFVWLESKGIFH